MENGGPTRTHTLLAGSPAIDAGDPLAVGGVGGVPTFDQRGGPYVRVYDGNGDSVERIDIGAIESQTVTPAQFGDFNADGRTDAADYTVWRNTLGSTTDLRANGDDTGASEGVIDEADYAVWKEYFGWHKPRPSRVELPPESLEAEGLAASESAAQPTASVKLTAPALAEPGTSTMAENQPKILAVASAVRYRKMDRALLLVVARGHFADARSAPRDAEMRVSDGTASDNQTAIECRPAALQAAFSLWP